MDRWPVASTGGTPFSRSVVPLVLMSNPSPLKRAEPF